MNFVFFREILDLYEVLETALAVLLFVEEEGGAGHRLFRVVICGVADQYFADGTPINWQIICSLDAGTKNRIKDFLRNIMIDTLCQM